MPIPVPPVRLPAGLGCHRVRYKDQQQYVGSLKCRCSGLTPHLRTRTHILTKGPPHTHIQVWEELGWVVSFLMPRTDYALQAVHDPLTGVKRETVPKKEDTVSHRNKPRG